MLATVDFASLSASMASIPALMSAAWLFFLAIPFGMFAAALVQPEASSAVRTARNGRLYIVVTGRPPIWARRGETAMELSLRAA